MNNNPPFYIGQKVEYIDAVIGKKSGQVALKKGDVCTVSEVFTRNKYPSFWNAKSYWFISVKEYDQQIGFNAGDFAPIEENRIKYVAVSETLREKAVEIAAIETN